MEWIGLGLGWVWIVFGLGLDWVCVCVYVCAVAGVLVHQNRVLFGDFGVMKDQIEEAVVAAFQTGKRTYVRACMRTCMCMRAVCVCVGG
ncbi:MAG TPA: hypothetical protein V6C97_16225 [Oculatellaceae cyanobacterium]